jgi:hypothetical protein
MIKYGNISTPSNFQIYIKSQYFLEIKIDLKECFQCRIYLEKKVLYQKVIFLLKLYLTKHLSVGISFTFSDFIEKDFRLAKCSVGIA